MEWQDTWYVTFQTSEIVDHYDGKTVSCSRRGRSLHLNAFYRITVKARVHWLPIWITNDDLSRVLESRGDIKSLHYMTENKIITGIRGVVFYMRKGDQNHLPYLTSVHGHRLSQGRGSRSGRRLSQGRGSWSCRRLSQGRGSWSFCWLSHGRGSRSCLANETRRPVVYNFQGFYRSWQLER